MTPLRVSMTSTYRCMGSPFLKSVPDPETDVQREMIRSNITSHYLVLGSQPIRIPSPPSHTHVHTPSWVTLKNRPSLILSESSLTSVAEQLCEQRVCRGDHRRGLGWQLIEQPRYGAHPAPLRHTEPRRHAQTGQAARQRDRAQHL